MKTIKKTKGLARIGGIAAAAALLLSGCGASNSTDDSAAGGSDEGATADQNWADCIPGTDAKDTSSMDADGKKDIKIAAFNGWDESFAVSHLLKNNLEKKGYKVSIKAFDAAPGYVGVANGDYDFLVDGWLPLTHADYVKKYGDKLDAQGCWYNNAKLTLAVNKDSKAKTIEDLKTMGGDYDNTLYGIEAGAGLTKATKQAIKDYGLDNINFKPSSTPAMLTQLKKATDAKKDVAVTLWRPHWAYDQFPVRDLEDPKGSMGKAEVLYNFSNKEFTGSNPQVAQLLKNLVLDDDHLGSLENDIQKTGDDKIDDAVAKWVDGNGDWVSKWEKGELKGEANSATK
ncbi:glycine betaine ABC transporter substrate-binding protein [Brevibacterium sp. 91QC2O2]|uniref:glycine betaine ABC transporter substrate-binding protein n=1 Tax=Brevibacterium sp. 91QC2O2 TaxID=2968458 RepID=UPI00211CAD0B|nr:glycine betaine ABC transporter substrate-binding protein [Brevibacterium sp. 91QC2O2]MCQ9369289.1 glycine betaine ABC transporter substrate-binding protein [Brevibacterium sp. 91QC2O2]